jgi:hypothetical protein
MLLIAFGYLCARHSARLPKGEAMTDRWSRRGRRFAAWLVAALLGAVGALTIVTPAHAAGTCVAAFRAIAWPASDGRARWVVEGTMTNTGTVDSTNWVAITDFPWDAVIPQYWNVTSTGVNTYWLAAPYNRVIRPGQSANFGFEVDTPSWDVSPLPDPGRCVITY